jgi:hypothetical protein
MRAAHGAPPEYTDRAPDGSGGVGPLLHLRDVYDSSVRKARLRHVHGAHSRSRTHPAGPVYEVVSTSAGRQVRRGTPEPTPMVRTIPGPCQVARVAGRGAIIARSLAIAYRGVSTGPRPKEPLCLRGAAAAACYAAAFPTSLDSDHKV